VDDIVARTVVLHDPDQILPRNSADHATS